MKSVVLRPAVCLPFVFLAVACKEEARVATYTVPKETAMTAAGLPANHPPMGATTPTGTPGMTATPALAAQTSGFATPAWTVPAGWREQPASAMRKGTWKIGPADAEAELAVSVFPGDVGGLAANVNRWAGQIGLPPLTESELKTKVTPAAVSGAPDAVRVTLANAGRATLAVSAPHGGGTWFFKLSGPETTVTAAAAEFDQFVASVKFAPAQ